MHHGYANRAMTKEPRARGGSQFGTVSTWKSGHGLGFITPADGGADLFVHVHNVSGQLDLSAGERMSLEVEMDLRKRKPEAKNVTLIADQTTAAAQSN